MLNEGVWVRTSNAMTLPWLNPPTMIRSDLTPLSICSEMILLIDETLFIIPSSSSTLFKLPKSFYYRNELEAQISLMEQRERRNMGSHYIVPPWHSYSHVLHFELINISTSCLLNVLHPFSFLFFYLHTVGVNSRK